MNLLWALPTHLPAAFLLGSNKRWVRSYFKGVAWLSVILIFGWPALTQTLNISLAPIIIWMGYAGFRYARTSNNSA